MKDSGKSTPSGSPDTPIDGIAMWQYTESGSVRGIAGDVDLNLAFYDLAEVIRRGGLNHLK